MCGHLHQYLLDPRPTLEVTRGSSVALCLAFLLSSSPKKWVPGFVHCLGYHFSRRVLFPDSNQSLASVTVRYEPRTIWSVPHHVWHFDDIGLFVVVCFIYFIGAAVLPASSSSNSGAALPATSQMELKSKSARKIPLHSCTPFCGHVRSRLPMDDLARSFV